jgi:colicin import membrane protein
MKNLITVILLTLIFFCSAQSKNEIQQKLNALETSQSKLFQEISSLKQDIAVLKSELESVHRENDLLKQLISAGSGKQSMPDSIMQKSVDNNSTPGRCKAITSKGTQCSRTADVGSEYCWQHKSTYEPNSTPNKSVTTPSKSTGNTGSGRKIYTGPRGGKYYINSNGNKTYIK